jgi:predicted nucleotide-binding protein
MIEQFQGEKGKATLLRALKSQFCVRDNQVLALELAEKVRLNEYLAGHEIIIQGSEDNEIHFILAGLVDVKVNDRHIAYREGGAHIGDMAMIDQRITRSASVTVIETTVTASLSFDAFHDLGDKYPQLWRYLALELSNRLRQRNNFIRVPNPIPELFLSSSKESMQVIDKIMNLLDSTQVKATPWLSGEIFHPSDRAIEDLEIQLSRADFAAFVFSPDDVVISKDEYYQGPRDNVITELGLFAGAIGRKRTYIIKPQNMDIKAPADLLGVNEIPYKYNQRTYEIEISSAVKELVRKIESLGVR